MQVKRTFNSLPEARKPHVIKDDGDVTPLFDGKYDEPCHPYRDGYNIEILVNGVNEAGQQRRLKSDDYLTVKSLPNTCHTVRQEFAAIFCSNVHLNVEGWGHVLLDLVEERPMIAKGIKSIELRWSWTDSPYYLNYEILQFCRYGAEHLILDELVLKLQTTDSIVTELLQSRGKVEWIQAVRSMNAKTLTVNYTRAIWPRNCNDCDSDPEYGGLIDIENQDALCGDMIEGDESEFEGNVELEAAQESSESLRAIETEDDFVCGSENVYSKWERAMGRKLQALLQRRPKRLKEYTAEEEYLRTREQ